MLLAKPQSAHSSAEIPPNYHIARLTSGKVATEICLHLHKHPEALRRRNAPANRFSAAGLLVHCQYDLPDLFVGVHVLISLGYILEAERFGNFRHKLSSF
jgi:hypothetical protein